MSIVVPGANPAAAPPGTCRRLPDPSAAGRDSAALGEASFDARKEVILEREPHPAPVAADTQGIARIVREGTDFMEIDARWRVRRVLLVTTPGARLACHAAAGKAARTATS